MIKKIAVENFRGFKENTEFDLAPITLLTGPNNSGKSSFLKLLNLLKVNFGKNKNLSRLFFDQGQHNLGTFKGVINFENTSDEIKLTIDFPLDYFDEEFQLELIYQCENENGILNSFKIFNVNRTLFHMNNIDSSYDETSIYYDFILDIKYLKRTYNKNTICKDSSNYSDLILKSFEEFNSNQPLKEDSKFKKWIQSLKSAEESLVALYNGENQEKKNQSEPERQTIEIDEFAKKYFFEEYSKLSKRNDFVPFSILNGKFNKPKEHYEKLLNISLDDSEILKKEEEFFSKFENINSFPEDLKNFISEMFINEAFDLWDFYFQFNFLFDDNAVEFMVPKEQEIQNFKTFFIQNIATGLKRLGVLYNGIDFISAHRGNKGRILSNKSNNDIDEIVKEFQELGINRKDESFLNDSLNVLGIKGEIVIERIEGVASLLYLEQNGKKISFSDLGYGYSQVIPILFKILLADRKSFLLNNSLDNIDRDIHKKHNYSIIIEEPEANLHPNLQSKLADIFVLAYKEFGIHFILETHSEYLIRKLQYLTAKEEIEPGAVNIYYYNEDQYVNEKEPKVKLIEIDQFGGLTDTFGPGFFDEATKLQFELLKLFKSQQN